jgi:glycosyltransferase involved in cell wall biosynthesis
MSDATNNTDKITIIIPAYNESSAIGEVVSSISKTMAATKHVYEIVVVDDGSGDDTASVAERAGATVIRHILNTGSGGATATGLSYAYQSGSTIAATMDADGQHDPGDVVNGINLMSKGGADLLIGSRLIDAAGMSTLKIIGNKGLSLITYLLFGINVTDSQSGLRIFSRNALHRLKWKTSGYEFCSEMLWRAKQSALIINEYPIKAIYSDYSRSKGQNNWNAFNILKALIHRRIMETLSE